MSISKVVKHAIRNTPGVGYATFRSRKLANGNLAEFCTIQVAERKYNREAVDQNRRIRDEVDRIVGQAYDWRAAMTSGSMHEFTIRLNWDYH